MSSKIVYIARFKHETHANDGLHDCLKEIDKKENEL